jgi:hypothetical protein
MTTDDDPPEPGSTSRDLLVEQADAAHERAVRKLQDDVRLADRFEELEQGSRDMLFYRINRRPTAKGIRPTQPGLGNVVTLRPEDQASGTPSPAEQPKDDTRKIVEAPSPTEPAAEGAKQGATSSPEPGPSDPIGEAVTPRPVELPGAGSTQRIASPPVPSAYVSSAEPSEPRRSSAPIALLIAVIAIGGLVVTFFLLRGEDPREATETTSLTTAGSTSPAAGATSAGASVHPTAPPTPTMSEMPPAPSAPPSASAIQTSRPKDEPAKPPQGRNPPDEGPRPLGGKKQVRY